MILPDLDELGTLEAIAGYYWDQVKNPPAGGDSINPTVNKEQAYIRAVRAEQEIDRWYRKNEQVLKRLVRSLYQVSLEAILSRPPSQ